VSGHFVAQVKACRSTVPALEENGPEQSAESKFESHDSQDSIPERPQQYSPATTQIHRRRSQSFQA